MAEWRKVAEGPLVSLRSLVGELTLDKGDRVQVKMDLRLPVAYGFDAPGMERVFQPLVPSGVAILDVRGEGLTTGVVELEADPVPLAAILGFISTHWLQIVVAGLALSFIVVWVTVLVKVTSGIAKGGSKLPILILAGILILAFALARRR